MTHEMELWYGDTEGEFIEVKVEGWEVSCKTTTEVDAPLASNIVRDEKLANTRVEVACN